jgi:hypothetical protein
VFIHILLSKLKTMSEISESLNVYSSLFYGEIYSTEGTEGTEDTEDTEDTEHTTSVPRNILQPFEPYVYDPNSGCKAIIIKKILYLPKSQCIDCQNTIRETLSRDDESCLYGNIHCDRHARDFCSSCQIQEPNGYQYVGRRGYGFCADCAESTCKYRLPELSKHFHDTYCTKSYNSCNYREDEYCPYFHSAISYDRNGGNIFNSIENRCRDAILARENKKKTSTNV